MKRFWTDVSVVVEPGGFGLRLDARTLNTPARAPVIVPGRELADALADEWRKVEATVDPLAMPLTRAVNVTIDRVLNERAAIAERVAAYGESDLLCYRAPHPPGLVARQMAAWDPLLDWADAELGARLRLAEGVMHVAQPADALAALRSAVETHSAWTLTPLHELVTLSGSLVIGLAVAAGELTADAGWAASRIDEDWNAEHWGEDAEAAEQASRRQRDFLSAGRLISLLETR